MTASAAFFDLDRTLLMQGSGRLLAKALAAEGLDIGTSPALADLAFAAYDIVGETLPSVLLSRESARRTRGWPVESVRRAAETAADSLVGMIEPFGLATMAEHRAAGRALVLATGSPYDLVRPLADRLGFDDVLATRHRIKPCPESGEMVLAGSVDGEFVWGRGKARSVEVWARANLVNLLDSYGYSDSFFDVPMLKAVGYPVAVNPDARLLAYATYKGWPRRWFNAPPGVPKPLGVEPQDLAAGLLQEPLLPWLNLEVSGLSHVPRTGGALLVADRLARFDPYAIALALRRIGRPIRVAVGSHQRAEHHEGHHVGPLGRAFGILDPGHCDYRQVLNAGEVVAVAPAGDDVQTWGADAGVPVFQVRLRGSDRVWPDSARFPYVMNVAQPPTVHVGFEPSEL